MRIRRYLIITVSLICLVLLCLIGSYHQHQSAISKHSVANTSDRLILLESDCYRLTQFNGLYECSFFDKAHNVVRSEEISRMPNIELLPSGDIKFSISTGPERLAQWGYYFDHEKGVFSGVFTGIYDQTGWLVAHGGTNSVVIKSIYDDSYYYKIDCFSYELSSVVEPIVSVAFLDDGSSVSVTYLSGDMYEEVTEIFSLQR